MTCFVNTFLRPPAHPLTASSYLVFLGRLLVFYIGMAVLAAYLAMLALIGFSALASAVPERPAPAAVHGCAVTLPNTPDDDSAPLVVRTVRPLSDCDESAPVAWGASVRDGYTGGRR